MSKSGPAVKLFGITPGSESSPGARGGGGDNSIIAAFNEEGGDGDLDGLDYGDLNALIHELEAARGR